jgi:hypothetical protein
MPGRCGTLEGGTVASKTGHRVICGLLHILGETPDDHFSNGVHDE